MLGGIPVEDAKRVRGEGSDNSQVTSEYCVHFCLGSSIERSNPIFVDYRPITGVSLIDFRSIIAPWIPSAARSTMRWRPDERAIWPIAARRYVSQLPVEGTFPSSDPPPASSRQSLMSATLGSQAYSNSTLYLPAFAPSSVHTAWSSRLLHQPRLPYCLSKTS